MSILTRSEPHRTGSCRCIGMPLGCVVEAIYFAKLAEGLPLRIA